MELATTFRTYLDQVGTITDLSLGCHRNIDTIQRYLDLLELPSEVIESASRAGLSFRRWRAVSALPTTAEQLAAIRNFAAEGSGKPDRPPVIKTSKATNRTRMSPSDASPSETPMGFPGRFQRTCVVTNGDKSPHKIKITVEGRKKHIEPGELRQVLVELLSKTYGEATNPVEAARRLLAELDTKGNES